VAIANPKKNVVEIKHNSFFSEKIILMNITRPYHVTSKDFAPGTNRFVGTPNKNLKMPIIPLSYK